MKRLLLFMFLVALVFSLTCLYGQEEAEGIYYSGGNIIVKPAPGTYLSQVTIRMEFTPLKSHNGFDIPSLVFYTIDGSIPSRASKQLTKGERIIFSRVGAHILKAKAFGKVGKYAGKLFTAKYLIKPKKKITKPVPVPPTPLPRPPVETPMGKPADTETGKPHDNPEAHLVCHIYKTLANSPGLRGFPVIIEGVSPSSVTLKGVDRKRFYAWGEDPVENFWEKAGYEDKVADTLEIVERITKRRVSWLTFKSKSITAAANIMAKRMKKACKK